MAKKNNLVGGAKAKISLILIAGMAAGWGISGYTVVLQNSVRKQNAMVEKAAVNADGSMVFTFRNGLTIRQKA